MNEKKDLTIKEKAILCSLAEDGPSWSYNLSNKGKEKIASYKTVLEGCHHLVLLGLVELKKEQPQENRKGPFFMGRRRDYYGLTFHGLLFSLNIDVFTEKEAANVGLRNFVKIPYSVNPPSFVSEDLLEQASELIIPKSQRDELERVKLELETILKPEREAFNAKIQRIISKARRSDRNVEMFSFIEQKYSERIYKALRRVNPTPGSYDEEYAVHVFQKEHNECFQEFLAQVLKGDKQAFEEMGQCLKDPYSLAVLQKALFSHYAKAYQTLLKFEPNSESDYLREWRALSDWFSNLAKAKSDEVKNQLRAGPQAVSKIKDMMNRL